VDFHDAKGELLHQALMPKKMAKLDESPDFRPFKFRIQAFTNAFAEEVRPSFDCRNHITNLISAPNIAPKIGSSGRDPVRQEDQVISVEPEIDFQIQ
jgi:hypothetical protein